MENTIFVQIASYRDHQLIPTLTDMMANADHPELIRVTVCWQHAADESLEDFQEKGFTLISTDTKLGDEVHTLKINEATVELIDLHYLKTHGACWARNKIQQHYGKEKYTLQLDSHHRFIQGWDTVLIDMLESVRDVSPKPLLTAYISSFDPENDPAGRIQEPWKMDFDRFIPEGAVFFRPSTIDDWRERTKPMLSRFYSAHFAFADGSFAEEVQHDPEYFFHGEEISIGVRAFTHGYDLYHPHRVVAWHEYTRKGRVKVWDDHTTQQKQKGKVTEDWWERNVKCHKRNRILFGMDGEDASQIDFGKYGFGTTRTVKQFEEYAGMSFKWRGVQQKVLDRVEPSLEYQTYDSEDEFKATIARSNDVRVCFHRNDVQWNPQTLKKKVVTETTEGTGKKKKTVTVVSWVDVPYTVNAQFLTEDAMLVGEGDGIVYALTSLVDANGIEQSAFVPAANVNYTDQENTEADFWFAPRSPISVKFEETDFDFFYVGTADEHGTEIFRKDLSEDEINNYFKSGEWVDYRFIFMCDPSKVAKTYVVWPHSKTKGWLNRIDRLADS